MLAVEGVVGPPSTTITTTTTSATFSAPAAGTMTMATAATAPTVVAGAPGVGLLPLVSVAAGGEPVDPRALLVPVPVPAAALSGSNPVGNGTGPTTTSSPPTVGTNNNNNNNNTATNTNTTNNTNTMEQSEELVKPIVKPDGEVLLEVECGQNKAAMYLSKLCQGSKGPCIHFQGSWLTPNEFQFVSGRETAKDWKRSIRHHGKSLKLLLSKGFMAVHPTMCDCEGCRIGAVLTRKGEKRRIPNGERKRKSTGNAPENSGSGAFRTVANLSAVKNQDGPPDCKRPALDKALEGNQSPLKESSLLNLPPEVKEGAHLADVKVGVVDARLPPSVPLIPLAPTERDGAISGVASALAASQDSKDISLAAPPRHPHPQPISVSAPVSPASDVKVLSSSSSGAASTAAISALDKSMSRLALYHAASASLKGTGAVGVSTLPELPRSVSVPKRDKPSPQHPISSHEKSTSSSSLHPVTDSVGQSASDAESGDSRSPPPPPQQEVKESPLSEDAVSKTDAVVSVSDKTDTKDLRSDDGSQTVISHSVVSLVKVCEPNNNNNTTSSINTSSISVSVSTALSPAAPVAALTSPVIASAAPAASNNMPHMAESDPQDFNKKHSNAPHPEPSSSCASSASLPLPSPHNKHLEKERHITIRHPSPERQPQEPEPPVKHSPVRLSKDHSAEKHKDRKSDCSTSTSPEHRERHSSKDSKDVSTSRGQTHDRESDRRRQEERSDRDRKASGSTSGPSSKADDASNGRGPEPAVVGGSGGGGGGGGGGGRVEGIPTSTPVMPPVPVPGPMPDPVVFSEYMRALAANHSGFMPPPVGCIPGMFPLRPPTDPSLSSAAMMYPMQAAACGVFSSPTALLHKDPVMYPAGTLPSLSYGYGAPGMPPVPLIPQQYSTAATASMLDYSRPFPYLTWPNLPLMMPDAMSAAAAAAAAAGSSAKRSREEMESAAMDKRLQLSLPPYGMGSVTPMDYMAAYRGIAVPASGGLESAMFDKNAEILRKRMYEMSASMGNASKSLVESPYLASLPDYYKTLYCCSCIESQPGDIRRWSVEEVVKLVSSLEGCSVYSEIFREQRVCGKILVLLTTEHLMKNLGMKLGPAVTLISRVAKLLMDATRSSGCSTCQRLASCTPAVQSAISYTS
ncbi:uncharacterized protein LOC143281479 [Babylonia areolata]|uniref:uncharacterized protein LOC143281479 n=1 Tax=Babylonia areolata TaxID=304850 RepID=UPI003FD2A423